MKIFHDIRKIGKIKKAVVALGVFDGVHRGHLKILKAAIDKAKKIKGNSVVLTFWPHPRKEESLYSLKHRLRLLESLGIDVCIVIKFSKNFSNISAEEFVKRILVGKIGANYIYIGENFHFGKAASGGFNLLFKLSKVYNYAVKKFSIIRVNRHPVSSTAVRKLIKEGNLEKGRKLLGRRVSVLGSVIRGSRLGRRLGVPTANIDPHHEVIPPDGIYAVKVIIDGKIYPGICYIGRKPTLDEENKNTAIEVHIFDFNKDIYGKYLEIQFLKLIRPDKKFASIGALTLQIQKDIISCRKLLGLKS